MKLDIAEVKSIVYPVRFDPKLFEKIKKVAKANKTSPSKVIRLFVEKGLMSHKNPNPHSKVCQKRMNTVALSKKMFVSLMTNP